MAELFFSKRKGSVLTRPSLQCLSPYHTINLTAGCPFSCRYCYAQSFRTYPGRGRVVFYANSLALLKEQLPRKRRAPSMVFFSSACDPFAPFPQVLQCLFGCMSLLLQAGSRVLISTKGNIPTQFIDLFARYPGQVYVEIGLTTVDENVRQLFEPCATTIAERLQLLETLNKAGIASEIRMIPLIPELTDVETRFEQTMETVSRSGVTRGAMSYLFLRPGNMDSMTCRLEGWRFRDIEARVFTEELESPDGRSAIMLPTSEYRANKYKVLAEIASNHGIHLRLCSCKNPDIVNDCCHPFDEFSHQKVQRQQEKTGDLFAGLDNR